MYDLSSWTLAHAARCASHIRQLGESQDVSCLEDVAQRVAEHLHVGMRTEHGNPALALARVYRTSAFKQMPSDLQRFAQIIGSVGQATVRSRCAALLGTSGAEAAWCQRATSRARRALPLGSAYAPRTTPLLASMLHALDFEPDAIPPEGHASLENAPTTQDTSITVHLLDASSALLADRDFLLAHDIASVIGMTGRLHDGEVFGVLLFARVPLQESWLEGFGLVAHATRVAMTPWARGPVYREDLA